MRCRNLQTWLVEPESGSRSTRSLTNRNNQVFKILWSEPQGQSRDNFRKVDIETYTDRMHLTDEMGDKFYVGFRRFIVVANDEGHCTCVYVLAERYPLLPHNS